MPAPADSTLLALAFQLEQSQWWSPEAIDEHQRRQLALLLSHAARTVPLYARRLGALRDIQPGHLSNELFSQIPILERREVQESTADHRSREIPRSHGATTNVTTSGSTGRPVRIETTALCRLFHGAMNLRYHVWHRRDLRSKLAALRRVHKKPGDDGPQPWAPGFATGPMVSLDVGTPFSAQLDWLVDQDAPYLLTYPSNLRGLLTESASTGNVPGGLVHVITYGEVLDESLRRQCTRLWGVPVVDSYSAQEIGAIAFQCPEHEHYHVQSETVRVEVLDDEGQPCAPGQLGRVVVTDLHNFATPMIRYAVGDLAEPGEPCSCGRGLPVLRDIRGRTRALMTLPTGERFCPRFLTEDFAFESGVRQIQVIQESLERVRVLLAVAAPLSLESEELVKSSLRKTLQHDFSLEVDYVTQIPLGPNGKFEEFRSEVDPVTRA